MPWEAPSNYTSPSLQFLQTYLYGNTMFYIGRLAFNYNNFIYLKVRDKRSIPHSIHLHPLRRTTHWGSSLNLPPPTSNQFTSFSLLQCPIFIRPLKNILFFFLTTFFLFLFPFPFLFFPTFFINSHAEKEEAPKKVVTNLPKNKNKKFVKLSIFSILTDPVLLMPKN